jgi:hypothetical protein
VDYRLQCINPTCSSEGIMAVFEIAIINCVAFGGPTLAYGSKPGITGTLNLVSDCHVAQS